MTWLPLFWLTLSAAPAVAMPQVEQLQTQIEELRQRSKDESYLLNQTIALPKLSFWDSVRKEWRTPEGKLDQPPAGKVRILHIWADHCGPCKEEFPILKDMNQQLRKDYHGDVQFTYVAVDTHDSEAMKKFWLANSAQMPVGPLFGDHNDDLTRTVEGLLPQKPQRGTGETAMTRLLPLPMTLVLDQEGVVRQALVGSIVSRRAELVNGVAQVYRWVKEHESTRALNLDGRPAKIDNKHRRNAEPQ
jgi:thiol-disulfide isomerase/thioredoxin